MLRILNPDHPPTLNLGLDLSQPHSSGSQLSSISTTNVNIHSLFHLYLLLILAFFYMQDSSSKVKENEELKLQQKKQFEKISNDLKKDKLLEKEARQRALLEIKEDQEKRKAKGLLNATHTPQQQQILTERQKIQQRIKREKQLDREQRQRILQNIKNDQKDKKSKAASVSNTTPKATVVSSNNNTSEAFIQVNTL